MEFSLDKNGSFFPRNYLPGVSAASPRRILFGLRAFLARGRVLRMHADQILFLEAMTC